MIFKTLEFLSARQLMKQLLQWVEIFIYCFSISFNTLWNKNENYVLVVTNFKLCVIRKQGKENTIVRDYVLPDYTVIKRGYVRSIEETSKQPKSAEQQVRFYF